MREVINIHVGQAGVMMGSASWKQYNLEHSVDMDGKLVEKPSEDSTLDSFYYEAKGKYIPRALFLDLEPSVVDDLKHDGFDKLFHPEQMITGKEDAANNFARGFYTTGKPIVDKAMDRLRILTDQCESFQGFIFHHSVGGGTGSGSTAALIEQIAEEFPKKLKFEFAVHPSNQNSTAIVEPYNTTLSLQSNLNNMSLSFMVDNQSLFNICKKNLNIQSPTYSNLNALKSHVESAITSSLRCQGMLNVDLQDFQTNLVPYPRIHFPVISYAPIYGLDKAHHENQDISELTKACFDPGHSLSMCDPRFGKYMSTCLLYRGDICSEQVSKAIYETKQRIGKNFVKWSPTGFKVGICGQPPMALEGGDLAEVNKSVCALTSTTAVLETWDKLSNNFEMMFKRKAFVHWYVGEGMEYDEFVQAHQDLSDIKEEYESLNAVQQPQNFVSSQIDYELEE